MGFSCVIELRERPGEDNGMMEAEEGVGGAGGMTKGRQSTPPVPILSSSPTGAEVEARVEVMLESGDAMLSFPLCAKSVSSVPHRR